MSYTYNPDEIDRRELAPGVFLRTMWGEKIMMSVVEIAANSEVPMHQHPTSRREWCWRGSSTSPSGA